MTQSVVKLDHVTYQVPLGHLSDASLDEFFRIIELQEVRPDEEVEKGWNVRWFQDKDGFQIHLVEASAGSVGANQIVDLELGHFCMILSRRGYKNAMDSIYLTRNCAESPRAWLRHAGTGIRVEIRPIDLGQANALCDLAEISFDKVIEKAEPSPTEKQLEEVFARCLAIFRQRNTQHNDSWRREGWRGCLFNLRRKAERAWDYLWNLETQSEVDRDADDLYDAINYAALAILCLKEGNRDGKGGWWGD
jgi:hypothetical protein